MDARSTYQDFRLGVVNSFGGSFFGVFKSKIVHLATLLTRYGLGLPFGTLSFFKGYAQQRGPLCVEGSKERVVIKVLGKFFAKYCYTS